MNLRASTLWFVVIALVSMCIGVLPAQAENTDPLDDGRQYAYAENIGWLNAEPNGDGHEGVQVAGDKITGWIWAENIGWVSLSCENTESCSAVDYGVENDGTGNLSGFAWSENAGWISFSCESTGCCREINYGVQIDFTTGKFGGSAWGENLGWLSFDSRLQSPHMIVTSWGEGAGTIAGRVWINFGGHTDLSVRNATIKLEFATRSTTTDANGKFELSGIPPGTYTMVVTAEGMIPLRKELTIAQWQQLSVDLPQMTVLNHQDLDQAVADAIAAWDSGGDGKIGLHEAIRALQVVSGQRSE
jgi:hypothetical protein